MSIKIRESVNRGINLMIVGLLTFTALIMFAEVFRLMESGRGMRN